MDSKTYNLVALLHFIKFGLDSLLITKSLQLIMVKNHIPGGRYSLTSLLFQLNNCFVLLILSNFTKIFNNQDNFHKLFSSSILIVKYLENYYY